MCTDQGCESRRKRTRRVRDRVFMKFERSRRYRDRYRCHEKKSRRGRAHDQVFRDPPTPRTRPRSLFAVYFNKHFFHLHFTINLLIFMNFFLVKQLTK